MHVIGFARPVLARLSELKDAQDEIQDRFNWDRFDGFAAPVR
jgi:hypothetical protein